jgi:hypothetical protein
MDLSSTILTFLGLTYGLTSTLYSYAREVKDAKRDIQDLSSELFALIGVLEHLKRQQSDAWNDSGNGLVVAQSAGDGSIREDSTMPIDATRNVLNETMVFVQELYKTLEIPKKRSIQRLTWPLKDSQTKSHLQRLERAKTYFILAAVTDDRDQIKAIGAQLFELSSLLKEDREAQRNREQCESPQHLSCLNAHSIRRQIRKNHEMDCSS